MAHYYQSLSLQGGVRQPLADREEEHSSRTPDWFKRPFLGQGIYEYNPRSRLS
jgi:hypothetical protein